MTNSLSLQIREDTKEAIEELLESHQEVAEVPVGGVGCAAAPSVRMQAGPVHHFPDCLQAAHKAAEEMPAGCGGGGDRKD